MSSSNGHFFVARDVHKHFGGVVACAVDELVLEEGQLTSLIGPNGAGKTTFFDVVTGFTSADRGQISFKGRDISGHRPHTIANMGLVRTFQLTKALERMSVLDNMTLAAPEQNGERIPWMFIAPGSVRRRQKEVQKRALELLGLFDIVHLKDDYAGTLSGGQKKLLELARALMSEPKMMLLDEPMAGVNPALGERLLDFVKELRDDGMTFLLVEHDMDVVMRVSERVVVMAEGQIIADGDPESVRTDQKVIDAYLGEHAAERIEEAERSAEEVE